MESGGQVSPPIGLPSAGPGTLSARTWLWLALPIAAGAGVLAASHAQVALDLALLTIGMAAILRWPFAFLLVVLAVVTRRSPFSETPFVELWVAASSVVLLPRLLHAPGRWLLLPLAAFLLFSLPGVDFGGSQLSAGAATSVVIPVLHVKVLGRPSPEMVAWIRVGFTLSLALLAALCVTDVRRLRIVFATVVAVGVYPVYVGLHQLLAGQFQAKGGFHTVQGPFSFPNEYGFYLVILIMLAIVAAFELHGRLARAGSALLALLALVLLQHTYTRSAWIGFALALLVLAVFRYRRLIVVGLIVFALSVVAVPGAVGSVQERFGDLSSQNASTSRNSLDWRRGEWGRMTHYGDQKPLTGQGFGSYQRLTVAEFGYQDGSFSTIQFNPGAGIATVGFAAHNDYVKLYVETGVPGVVLWVLVLIGLIATAASAARLPELAPWGVAVAGLGLAFALMSVSDNIQGYGVPLAILFTLSAALAGAYRRSAPPARGQAG